MFFQTPTTGFKSRDELAGGPRPLGWKRRVASLSWRTVFFILNCSLSQNEKDYYTLCLEPWPLPKLFQLFEFDLFLRLLSKLSTERQKRNWMKRENSMTIFLVWLFWKKKKKKKETAGFEWLVTVSESRDEISSSRTWVLLCLEFAVCIQKRRTVVSSLLWRKDDQTRWRLMENRSSFISHGALVPVRENSTVIDGYYFRRSKRLRSIASPPIVRNLNLFYNTLSNLISNPLDGERTWKESI